jgi:hypothetical protein
VGVGVTPETSGSNYNVLQIGQGGSLMAPTATEDMYVGSNVYRNSSNTNSYIVTEKASIYEQYNGEHYFNVAPSGSADAAISFAQGMKISNAGIVTKPLQPCFSAGRLSPNQNITANTETIIALNTKEFDIGNNFNTSTYRFTAPVAGRYLFTAAIQFNNTGGAHTVFKINGSTRNDGWVDFGDATASAQSRIYDLVSGDYVQLAAYHTVTTAMSYDRSKMTGFLIG